MHRAIWVKFVTKELKMLVLSVWRFREKKGGEGRKMPLTFLRSRLTTHLLCTVQSYDILEVIKALVNFVCCLVVGWYEAARLLGLRVRIPPWHGCPSLVSVMCCQVEVCASGWSLIQMSRTECDREISIMRRPWPTRGSRAIKKKVMWYTFDDLPPEIVIGKTTLNTTTLLIIAWCISLTSVTCLSTCQCNTNCSNSL